MKNKFILLIAPAVICWCFFSIQSCKQPLIGDKTLLTKNDTLNIAKDTVTVKVTSVYEKPLITSGTAEGILGSLYDRNFGTTVAGVYFHCELTSSSISFGALPQLDSAVFSVAFSGLYGLCNAPVDLSLYEMNQDVYDSVSYYSNASFAVKVPAISTLPHYVPNLIDSVQLASGAVTPEIRMRLSNTFGNKLLNADPNTTLFSNQNFLSVFKGFYLTTNSNTIGNGLMYLNLASSLSGITLYYRDSTNTALSYYLPIAGATINHFDNSYSGTPAAMAVNSGVPQQKLYLQGGIGVKGKIIIPNFDSIPKKVGINKAELVFSQVAGDTTYPTPLSLALFRIDDSGASQYLEDQGLTTFGGTLVTEVVNGVSINRYRFSITSYFQRLIQGIHNNNGLYVQIPSASSSSERVVIGNSTTDKNYQVSLVITYTKL